MYKALGLLFCLFIFPNPLRSQILPAEGSNLNYRLIGFETPAQKGSTYKLEIAVGNFNTEDSFRKNIVVSQDSKANKIMAEVPSFGSQYTWRIVAGNDKKQSSFHHFSTAVIPNADTNLMRLRIIKNTGAYKDCYVFIDGMRALYNMNGQPVWFLPNIWHFPNENFEVRDMKLTPQGTITLMIGDDAYEISYDGAILWKAPNNGLVSGGNSELYHHKLTRLANGHYMILGNELDLWNQQQPSPTDSSFVFCHDKDKRDTGKKYFTIPFGNVIEYDEKGAVVWAWRSLDYFKNSDLYYHTGRNGRAEVAAHENAFYFDEKAKAVYVSFRNISRIIKIKYPEGNVLNSYGETYAPGMPEKGNGLFCHQHSCKVSEQGYLYLYNNNVCGTEEGLPSIVMMQEPAPGKTGLKKVWEYECTTDGISEEVRNTPHQFQSGGNVMELPGNAIFASVCAIYFSKVFIVSKDKNILWSATPERRRAVGEPWQPVPSYEASIITGGGDMERLVWRGK